MRTRVVCDQDEIDGIISNCQVCYVGMVDENNMPYVVPFNFGYKDKFIYLHSAQKGRKIEIMNKNPNVCVAFSTDHLLNFQNEQVACSYSMRYRSVLAFGKIEFIDDPEKKVEVLNIIMSHYTSGEFHYNPPAIREVKTYRVAVEKFTGKVFGHKN
jgi:uncharacterized protein